MSKNTFSNFFFDFSIYRGMMANKIVRLTSKIFFVAFLLLNICSLSWASNSEITMKKESVPEFDSICCDNVFAETDLTIKLEKKLHKKSEWPHSI
ncbi:MAG: hypothetical protein ACKVJ1_12940, partial [Verrucomicrobiia bacterium]